MWNRYGATESCLGQLVHRVVSSDLDSCAGLQLPIGHLLPNSYYSLQQHASSQHTLFLGGPKLATRYLAEPQVHHIVAGLAVITLSHSLSVTHYLLAASLMISLTAILYCLALTAFVVSRTCTSAANSLKLRAQPGWPFI